MRKTKKWRNTQLTLLNFHKVISKFATNIVGAFVPLIIYQATKNFSLAFLYLILQNAFKIGLHRLLRKWLYSKPQVALLLRIFPFIIYSLSIFLLQGDTIVLGIILVLVFNSLSLTLGELPMEFVYSYSSKPQDSSSTGMTRFYEYAGALLAIFIGGSLLDNLNKVLVIVIACVTYIISVIPLVIYYFRQRKSNGFNKEVISNAVASYKKIGDKKEKYQNVRTNILVRYYVIYALYCSLDALVNLFGLYLFKVAGDRYSMSAYVQVSFYGLYGIGSILAGLVDKKRDMTIACVFNAIVCALCVGILPFFMHAIWIEIVLFGVIGVTYSFFSLFNYTRMMQKCKILGVSNGALINRANASHLSRVTVFSFCAIGEFMSIPGFLLIAASVFVYALTFPKNEEITRKILVDFLEEN